MVLIKNFAFKQCTDESTQISETEIDIDLIGKKKEKKTKALAVLFRPCHFFDDDKFIKHHFICITKYDHTGVQLIFRIFRFLQIPRVCYNVN